MSLIYTGTKSKKKTNKKPGWKKQAEDYAAWEDKHKPNPKLQAILKKKQQEPLKLNLGSSPRQLPTTGNSVYSPPKKEVVVHDPRVLYKDDPEMLERELKAKERKFTAAPIYNKGGDVYVTDEMMRDITSGTTRRR